MAQFQFANVPGSVQQGRQFSAINAQQAENLKQSQFSGRQATDLDALRKNIRSAVELKAVPNDQKASFLTNKISTGEAEGRDMTQSKKALELVSTGRLSELEQGTEQLLEVATRMGDIKPEGFQQSSSFREHQSLVDIVQNPESTQLEINSANRALGNVARAGLSSVERIAGSEDLTAQVASSQAKIAGARAEATEGRKLEQQLKHKPAITKAVKLAEKEATERGEVLTDLSRMTAGLPGLKDAVSQLRELSSIATSTIGGKIFDSAVKQTGFGATKGSTARAKMNAIIANQTLPLLKETFGSAFTEAEGARLQASFADPDATHEERLAQLDAFIDQKERTIKTKQAQLDATEGATEGGVEMTDANGNRAIVFPDGTFKEL